MKMFYFILLVLLSCSRDKRRITTQKRTLISSENKYINSTTTGNLITTAIKRVHNLDIVLYPSDLLDVRKRALMKARMNASEIEQVLNLYPDGEKDKFITGLIKGSDVKRLILGRINDTYRADVQAAGIRYKVSLIGGIVQLASFTDGLGNSFDEDKVYRIGLSRFFFSSKEIFPGYRMRNNLNLKMKLEEKVISAKKSLKTLLVNSHNLSFLKEQRVGVKNYIRGDIGKLRIYDIQGVRHISEYVGLKVKTTGIVTAAGKLNWYPKGYEFYMQDRIGDDRDETSDAIHVYINKGDIAPKIGDVVEVEGVIFEEMTSSGLGKTSLKNITSIKFLERGASLPGPVLLGEKGRRISDKIISTYIGDLNTKRILNLDDGIDFWESLEGMRVSFNNPKVVGFRGGRENYGRKRPKGHLSVFLVPDGDIKEDNMTPDGGIIPNFTKNDYNPEIIQITTNHLTRGLKTSQVYNIGEQIEGRINGVLSYEKNIYGDGEFIFALPQTPSILTAQYNGQGMVVLENRPRTKLTADDDHLTVATYNVENLAANQKGRLKDIAHSISYNLQCPDIVHLAEIQDYNGAVVEGGSSGRETLENLLTELHCAGRDYRAINIDPFNHREGGRPGGNIRVAFIYDAKRVTFKKVGRGSASSSARILENGSLNFNPGRVAPEDPAFKGTRRSLVAQFEFKSHKFFMIGNHFNSKLGDSSFWSNIQPQKSISEKRRIKIATKINEFVREIEEKSPNSHIIVLGDFNAYMEEKSMQILEGDSLENLFKYNNLIPERDRYTTNYKGNSVPLDYIFVNKELLKREPEVEIVHINSNFMGRLSDHDPVISRFAF